MRMKKKKKCKATLYIFFVPSPLIDLFAIASLNPPSPHHTPKGNTLCRQETATTRNGTGVEAPKSTTIVILVQNLPSLATENIGFATTVTAIQQGDVTTVVHPPVETVETVDTGIGIANMERRMGMTRSGRRDARLRIRRRIEVVETRTEKGNEPEIGGTGIIDTARRVVVAIKMAIVAAAVVVDLHLYQSRDRNLEVVAAVAVDRRVGVRVRRMRWSRRLNP